MQFFQELEVKQLPNDGGGEKEKRERGEEKGEIVGE